MTPEAQQRIAEIEAANSAAELNAVLERLDVHMSDACKQAISAAAVHRMRELQSDDHFRDLIAYFNAYYPVGTTVYEHKDLAGWPKVVASTARIRDGEPVVRLSEGRVLCVGWYDIRELGAKAPTRSFVGV